MRNINWREFGAVVHLIGTQCGVEVRLDPKSSEEAVCIHIQETIKCEGRQYLLYHLIAVDCSEAEELVEPVKTAICAAKLISKADMSSWGLQE